MSPRVLFSTLAFAEAATWVLLLTGMFLKYVTRTTEALVSIGGAVHGFVFLAYCAAAVLLWISQRWRFPVGALSLVAAVVPLATIPFEMWAARRGHLDGGWQLGAEGRRPENVLERAVSLAIRRPVVAGIGALLLVTLVFAGLMQAGPPVSA